MHLSAQALERLSTRALKRLSGQAHGEAPQIVLVTIRFEQTQGDLREGLRVFVLRVKFTKNELPNKRTNEQTNETTNKRMEEQTND